MCDFGVCTTWRMWMKRIVSAIAAVGMSLAGTADVTFENEDCRLVIGDDACAKSLVVKATGEECLDPALKLPMLTVTQDRPFDNELKLIHPNKRIVYPAVSVRRDGNDSGLLVFGFGHGLYEATVRVSASPRYILFRL